MIVVAMQDLAEADWKELEKELEEKMAERRQRKLAFFQKTRNGVVRKAYTAPASGVKVNASLSPEDLVHMVEVSVASKYGADLIQFTRVVAEDMRSMLDPFKQDLSGSLPRQVRAIVQQLSGESHEKRTEEFVATPNQGSTSKPSNRGVLANVSQGNTGANLNLQQPYY
jgi:RNase P protein component